MGRAPCWYRAWSKIFDLSVANKSGHLIPFWPRNSDEDLKGNARKGVDRRQNNRRIFDWLRFTLWISRLCRFELILCSYHGRRVDGWFGDSFGINFWPGLVLFWLWILP